MSSEGGKQSNEKASKYIYTIHRSIWYNAAKRLINFNGNGRM